VRNGKPTGGRANGYVAAREGETGQREIHQEQAETVRGIFSWYAAGKPPRRIAGELNRLGVSSPGASWNRTSVRLNAKRTRAWVAPAIQRSQVRLRHSEQPRLWAGDVLLDRIRGGNLGLRDPRSIIPARNASFAMFGRQVPLRPAVVKPGTKPYLVARVAMNRNVLLEAAASAAGCLEIGSGGVLPINSGLVVSF
jgi:hypothetical protein